MAINREFDKAVRRLLVEHGSLLRSCEEVSERVHVVELRDQVTFDQLGMYLSRRLGGTIWTRDTGLTWSCPAGGRQVDTGYLIPREHDGAPFAVPLIDCWHEVRHAVGIETGWSYANIGRCLLKWTGITQQPDVRWERIKTSNTNMYYCVPGRYEPLYHHDLTGCYYQLLRRLPSPLPRLLNNDQLVWELPEPEARSRWRDLVEIIGPHKRLRNSLVGSMAGSCPYRYALQQVDKGACPYQFLGVCWRAGERQHFVKPPGPLRLAALIVRRTAYERVWLACADTNVVYAQVDCAMSLDREPPACWGDLASTIKCEGPADVRAISVWRIGETATKYYHPESRIRPYPLPPAPDRWVWQEWL